MNRRERRAYWLSQQREAMRKENMTPNSVLNARDLSSRGKVHIEQLVLHGFPGALARAIGEATQQEMTRELRANGLAPQIHDARHITANSFHLPESAQPKSIGALVAKAVCQGFKQ